MLNSEENVIRGLSYCDAQRRIKYIPLLRNIRARTIIGFILMSLAVVAAETILDGGRIGITAAIMVLAWLPAAFIADKYAHKYPQRYFAYLIASHLKAAVIMAMILWVVSMIVGLQVVQEKVLWTAFIFFVVADLLVSVPRRRDASEQDYYSIIPPSSANVNIETQSGVEGSADGKSGHVDAKAVLDQIRSDLDRSLAEFVERNLPDRIGGAGGFLILDDIAASHQRSESPPVSLLVGQLRLNDVRRLNQYLQYCAGRIANGGYIVARYMPLENVIEDLRQRYGRIAFCPVFILHFIWYRAIPKIPWLDRLYFSSKISWLDHLYLSVAKKRNRVLSKAEIWGRLAFCGMNVIAESDGRGERYVIAQRNALPANNRRPSYYPIVALEKVGLDGKIVRLHKIRTMYPFSEFLQKRVFEDHGLASTGKFANDFRLTDYGRIIRRYWLDELPQIFDWLRGDVKLVGMRATSRHFLSLYPKELIDLYVQIKPGLIPPIFDESTGGFDQIIKVELAYLKRYMERPFRTDVRYFIQTFVDIFIRGVRSK